MTPSPAICGTFSKSFWFRHEIFTLLVAEPPCGPSQIFYQLANEASNYSSGWPVFINTHGDFIHFMQNSQQIVSHGNNDHLSQY